MTASAPSHRSVAPTTSAPAGRFSRLYGARPWHLLSLLASFALTAYAVRRLFDETSAVAQIALWFVGGAVLWDLVLGPALALADRVVRPRLGAVQVRGVSPLNHLRVPALVSSLLLLVFAPSIFQRSEQRYQAKAGLLQDPYLDRWAAVTLSLFALSALTYVVAVLRTHRRGRLRAGHARARDSSES